MHTPSARTAKPGYVTNLVIETGATPNTHGYSSPAPLDPSMEKKSKGSASPSQMNATNIKNLGYSSPAPLDSSMEKKSKGSASPSPMNATNTNTNILPPPMLSRRLRKSLRRRDKKNKQTRRKDPLPNEPFASHEKRRRLHNYFPSPFEASSIPTQESSYAEVVRTANSPPLPPSVSPSFEEFPTLQESLSRSAVDRTDSPTFSSHGSFIPRKSQVKRKAASIGASDVGSPKKCNTEPSPSISDKKPRYHLSFSSISSSDDHDYPPSAPLVIEEVDSDADIFNSEDEAYLPRSTVERHVNPRGDLYVKGKRRAIRRVPIETEMVSFPPTMRRQLVRIVKNIRMGVTLSALWRTATRLATSVTRDGGDRELFMRKVAALAQTDSRVFLKNDKINDTPCNWTQFHGGMFHRHGRNAYGNVSVVDSCPTWNSDRPNLLLEDVSVEFVRVSKPVMKYVPTPEDLNDTRPAIVGSYSGSESLLVEDMRPHMQAGTLPVEEFLGRESPEATDSTQETNPRGFSLFDDETEDSDKFAWVDEFREQEGNGLGLTVHYEAPSFSRKRPSYDGTEATDPKRSRTGSTIDLSTTTVPMTPDSTYDRIINNLFDLHVGSANEPSGHQSAGDPSSSAVTARSYSLVLLTAREASPSPADRQKTAIEGILDKISCTHEHIIKLRIVPSSVLDGQGALKRNRASCRRLLKEVSLGPVDSAKIDKVRRLVDRAAEPILRL